MKNLTSSLISPLSIFSGLLIFMSLVYSSELSDNYKHYEKHDYCKDLKKSNKAQSAPLPALLKKFQTKMNSSTGTYVLEKGNEALISRAWLTHHATKTIDIQYFIFTSDNLGLIAVDYLVRAADRGIQVRILVDDFMLDADVKDLVALSSHPNITIKLYNPNINIGKSVTRKIINATTEFRNINQRMHNKTFIVDGQVAITGGRNIADEYFGFDHEYNFKDRDVLLFGQAPKQIQGYFNLFWNDPISQELNRVIHGDKIPKQAQWDFKPLHSYACHTQNFAPYLRNLMEKPSTFQQFTSHKDFHWVDSVQHISDAPGKNDGKQGLQGGGRTTQALIKLIEQAKDSILIQTPYLVTTDLGLKVFQKATQRGVKVKILTNSITSTDNMDAFNGYQRVRQELLKAGVEIYELKPRGKILQSEVFPKIRQEYHDDIRIGLHAKSLVIDDSISMIGTFNLDPRSANLNTEGITIIHSRAMNKIISQHFIKDMTSERAWRVTPKFNPDSEGENIKRLRIWLRGWVPKSIL